MNPCGLTFGVTALANAIADNLSDDELNFVGAVFTQLGDTLTTISVQRDICKNNNNTNSDVNETTRDTNNNDYDN